MTRYHKASRSPASYGSAGRCCFKYLGDRWCPPPSCNGHPSSESEAAIMMDIKKRPCLVPSCILWSIVWSERAHLHESFYFLHIFGPCLWQVTGSSKLHAHCEFLPVRKMVLRARIESRTFNIIQLGDTLEVHNSYHITFRLFWLHFTARTTLMFLALHSYKVELWNSLLCCWPAAYQAMRELSPPHSQPNMLLQLTGQCSHNASPWKRRFWPPEWFLGKDHAFSCIFNIAFIHLHSS